MSADDAGRLAARAARAAAEARAALRELGPGGRLARAPAPGAESRRRAAAARLAKLFAALLAENKALRGELDAAGDSAANLMVKLAQDRRRWKAALLSVRRRLLTLRRPAPSSGGPRAAELASELLEAQETVAALLAAVVRARRGAEASRLGEERFRRRARREGVLGGAQRARDAYAEALDAGLRALADAPSADPDRLVRALEDARRLARGAALAAVAAAPPRAQRADVRAALAARLGSWEEAFRRRGATVLVGLDARWPGARADAAAFALVVDQVAAGALDRAVRGGRLMVKGGVAPGGLRVEFSDDGAPLVDGVVDDARAGGGPAHPGQGLFLARVVLRAWGGDLSAAPGAKGRGARVELLLPLADGAK